VGCPPAAGRGVLAYFVATALLSLWGPWHFAVALLGQLLVLLYYIPAHNKVMQTGEGISAFAVLLGAWLFARGRE